MKRVRYFATAAALLFAGASVCKAQSPAGLTRMEYPETFSQMVKPFAGRVVYVDVTASWCKPCADDRGHAAGNDAFFRQNDIAKLYISIDQSEDIDKCFALLKERGATGYFISYHDPSGMRAESSDYIAQVEKFFLSFDAKGNITGVSVPKYLIIDKNGRVVEYKAPGPGDQKALKEQLSKYL